MIQPSAAGALVGRENEVCVTGLEWGSDEPAFTETSKSLKPE